MIRTVSELAGPWLAIALALLGAACFAGAAVRVESTGSELMGATWAKKLSSS